jgi:DNA-directed RNA polymerase sigma subunit (sigma70/sigma32)
MNHDGLRHCSRQCMKNKQNCTVTDCRLWIDYKEEHNCCLIAVYQNGSMTLRQIGERLGISFARVKQIETKALKRLKKRRC